MALSSINIVLNAVTEAFNRNIKKAADTMDASAKRMAQSADSAGSAIESALGSGDLRQKIQQVNQTIEEQKTITREFQADLEQLRLRRDSMAKTDVQGQKEVRKQIEQTKAALKDQALAVSELTAKKQSYTQQLSTTNQTLGGTRAALNGLATSFSAVSSVIGILADDNKALRNTLMGLNAALNFSAAIMQVKDLQAQFGGLTKFLTNPWVLAAAAIAAATLAIAMYETESEKAARMQREVNNELNKATESAIASGVELTAYKAIVNDTTKSETERKGALIQLKKAGIEVDDINIHTAEGLKILNSRLERSIELSIQKAIVDKAASKIAELELGKIEAQKQAQEGLGATLVDNVLYMGLNVQRTKDAAKALSDANAQINLYKTALNNASTQVANLSAGVEQDTNAQKNHNAELRTGTKEAEKEAEAFRKLEESVLNVKNTGKSLLAPVDPIVPQSMDEVLNKLDEIPPALEGIKTPPLFTDVVQEAPQIVATTVEISDAFKQMADRNSESFQKNASAMYADSVRTKEWADNKKQALDALNQAFAQLQMAMAENFSQFIADMVTGEEKAGNKFGRNMIAAIANFMDVVGKAMVATAIASQKFEELLLANPAAAAIAGLALITGAAIVRNELKKGPEYTTFADGGIVSGPTLGLMGEYPGASTNPEVIAPLDKLKSLIGSNGANSGFVASTHISGRDLAIVLNRYNQDTKRG